MIQNLYLQPFRGAPSDSHQATAALITVTDFIPYAS